MQHFLSRIGNRLLRNSYLINAPELLERVEGNRYRLVLGLC